MASINFSGPLFSNDIDSVAITGLSGSIVNVAVTHVERGTTLLSVTLRAYNGVARLYDLRDIIEQSMIDFGCSRATINIATQPGDDDSTSAAATVVFCRSAIVSAVEDETPDEWLRRHFLTFRDVQRVPPNGTARLSAVVDQEETFEGDGFVVEWYETSGDEPGLHRAAMDFDAATQTIIDNASKYEKYIQISIPSIKSRLMNELAQGAEVEVVKVTATLAARSATVIVDPSLRNCDGYRYLNPFGVLEYLYAPTVTTATTSVEVSEATVNNRAIFFDRYTERTYETEAGPLLPEEADAFAQMCASTSVGLIRRYPYNFDTSDFTLIHITDMECELSDRPEQPHTVKFTWRYSSTRPVEVEPASDSIFTTHFTPEYQ